MMLVLDGHGWNGLDINVVGWLIGWQGTWNTSQRT
jgi:hypothetical protein